MLHNIFSFVLVVNVFLNTIYIITEMMRLQENNECKSLLIIDL
jgi:hypothetical protein